MASPSSLTDGGKAALDTTAEPQSPCSTLAAEDSVKFYDRSGEECESFIREVRKVAFREGKSRDTNWMADFASTCFFGQALRWYEALDLSVRCDWEGLKRALLEKYPSDMEPVIAPSILQALDHAPILTPPAAPLTPAIPLVGRIRISSASFTTSLYVGGNLSFREANIMNGILQPVSLHSEAVTVTVEPHEDEHCLKTLNPARSEYIGVICHKDSQTHAAVVLVNEDGEPCEPPSASVWTGGHSTPLLFSDFVPEDGELRPAYTNSRGNLVQPVIKMSGKHVFWCCDLEDLEGWEVCRLFFEEIQTMTLAVM